VTPPLSLQLNTITIKKAALADKFSFAANNGYSAVEMWIHEVAPHLMTEADWDTAQSRFLVPRYREAGSGATMARTSRLSTRRDLPVAGLIPGEDVLTRWHYALDDDMLDVMVGILEVCETLDARYVVLPVLGEDGTLQGTADNMKRIAEHAAPKEVRLGLEPMGHVEKCGRVPEALEILELAGLGDHAGLVVDCFHFFRAGQDVSAIKAIRGDQIVMVHVNDALDLPIEELIGNRHRTYPGHGIFDVEAFCTAILESGYDGPFTIEIMNEATWDDDPEVVCRMSFETARKIVDRAFDARLRDDDESA